MPANGPIIEGIGAIEAWIIVPAKQRDGEKSRLARKFLLTTPSCCGQSRAP